MKPLRANLILLGLLALAAAMFHPIALAAFALLVMVLRPRTADLLATFTVAEILTDVIKAFKTRLPALSFFSRDFGSQTVKYGQQIISHLPTVPATYAHTPANGYNDNAQEARSLLQDVAITINQWRDVPVVMKAEDISKDRTPNYLKTINNAGYALAKYVLDYALGTVVSANFSQAVTETIVDTSKDTLTEVLELANTNKMDAPRFGITGIQFMSALTNDSRIASRDYHGQLTDEDPYRSLRNLEGFKEIKEYPDFPHNSENLSAFFFDPRAVTIATRLPTDAIELAERMGLNPNVKKEIVTDPETGLSLVAFSWFDQNTHDIYITFSVMFGVVAGKQGGSSGAKTDFAGIRVKTA